MHRCVCMKVGRLAAMAIVGGLVAFGAPSSAMAVELPSYEVRYSVCGGMKGRCNGSLTSLTRCVDGRRLTMHDLGMYYIGSLTSCVHV